MTQGAHPTAAAGSLSTRLRAGPRKLPNGQLELEQRDLWNLFHLWSEQLGKRLADSLLGLMKFTLRATCIWLRTALVVVAAVQWPDVVDPTLPIGNETATHSATKC